MGIGDKIKKRRIDLGLSQEELAKKVGYTSRSTINKIELGKNDITQSKVIEFARALNTTPGYLMDWEDDEEIYKQAQLSYIKVPLYGEISCGNGAFVDDNIIDYIAVPDDGLNPNLEYFAQIASGDSMIEAGIENGDVIVFQKSNTIDDGKIGCFCIDDGVATCKKFKKGPSYIQLIPANRKYDPIVIDLQNSNFRVIGILKKAIKTY